MTIFAGIPVSKDAPRKRLAAIDLCRGGAIVLMAVYHFCWDLAYFGLAEFRLLDDPFWLGFRYFILCSFLAVAGISLALAFASGVSRQSFLRRLALITGCALVITLATRVLFPESYIFFGVLHFIALASVLGVLFIRLPFGGIVAAAMISLVLPLVVSAPLFDLPWLLWLGLVSETPFTNDYVPLFPWMGIYLFGLALGRMMVSPGPVSSRVAAFARPRAKAARVLEWAGRRSLFVYMVHQPILLGLVFAASIGIGIETTGSMSRSPDASESPNAGRLQFTQSCQVECENTGSSPGLCVGYCACMLKGVEQSDIVRSAQTDSRKDSEFRNFFSALTMRCAADHLFGKPKQGNEQ
ncbi:MAG: DUF1624 domain-containing protein [Rhodospirillales bacterium]|nr:DUF1624 domain-containing protein [Rhodospirillales bacterium]